MHFDYKCKNMIDRINLLLQAKNITAKQFAEEIGIQPSGMSHILGGRNNPSLDFVTKVLRRYPEIDAEWLLFGKGAMYKSSFATVSPTPLPVDTEPELPFSFTPPSPPAEANSFQPQEATSPLVSSEEQQEEPLQDPQDNTPLNNTAPDVTPQVAASQADHRHTEKIPELESILFVYSNGTFRQLKPSDQ